MQKKIYYHQKNNQISLDQKTWINSSKFNQYNHPIFDLNDKEWCSISITSDKQSLKCFLKDKMTDNSSWYYQDYVKLSNIANNIATFNCYRVEKNPATNKWEKPRW
ncbi:MAG: hypothetical protein LBR43_02355 [Spiroplasmataceae bacterium]|jgi:hypothetical protein|nr:hypothetical protein [Spiroplasmataceae bacterium]